MPQVTDFPLSPREAAEIAGVHDETIKRWAAAGKVRAFRTGGGWWRFNRADIEAFLASGVREPNAEQFGPSEPAA